MYVIIVEDDFKKIKHQYCCYLFSSRARLAPFEPHVEEEKKTGVICINMRRDH